MMHVLLERRSTAKLARALVAGSVVLAMAQAASARDDTGVHDFFSSIFGGGGGGQEAQPAAAASEPAYQTLPVRRSLERASRRSSTPRVAGERASPSAAGVAERTLTVKLHQPKASSAHQIALAPIRPGKVSIFEDRTLRRGDAVMTAKGIRIFAGSSSWPYQDRDFVALADARKMDKSMEQVLLDLDRLPRG